MHSLRKMIIWSSCLIFSLSYSILVFASSPAKHMCRPDQRDALREFKNEFHFSGTAPNEKTQRWLNNTDCCSWDGVSCDLKTGNVVDLNLWGSSLNGSLRSNSGNLSYLTHLDLQGNGFTGELPESMGKLNQLTKLLLSTSKLSGNFHHALLNLTELTWIDLRSNHLEGNLPSNMSSFSKLVHFDVGSNSFSGPIPSSLFTIPSLILLNLEKKQLQRSFLHLKSLVLLDLSYLNTRSLLELSLFSKLVSLSMLDLSGNHLKISSSLHLPSPLGSLSLASCNISEFPNFLRKQPNLYYLDISANQIEGRVPDWLWMSELVYLDISKNALTGFDGPKDAIQTSPLEMLDISSNTFQDPFPLLPNSTRFFSASDNRL
ncbi:unnamed protein product [Brassica oleracea var. botrytis]